MVHDSSEHDANEPLLTAEDVAQYLARHPDFLLRHPQLMTKLAPPAQAHKSKSVVDFQHFMLKRLQGDIEKHTTEKRDLISTARTNLNLLTRIHACVLALLEAEDFEALIGIITGDIAHYLDIDVTALMIEATEAEVVAMQRGEIRIVAPGRIDEWLQGRSVWLEGNIDGDPEIYGSGAGLVHSQALMRLEISAHAPVGMIAFGSRNHELFQDGQGTELVGFLARVIERLIRAWLDLPE
jgi:uncharacterized protein YigA (DUF484 family)